MLHNLSDQVRECMRQAEECGQRAKFESSPIAKLDFLEMEGRWLQLATSYLFLERLTSFVPRFT